VRRYPAARLTAVVLLAMTGCSSGNSPVGEPPALPPLSAEANLVSASGRVRGTVTLTREQGGVHIVARIEGLAPGAHAFTILAARSCDDADSLTAPEHWNPTQQPHGDVDSGRRHLGDLGNLVADASGNARYDRLDRGLTLEGPEAITGHALVVHVRADDPEVQPDGAAGPGIACGVITLVPRHP